jgi:hypothetical protein
MRFAARRPKSDAEAAPDTQVNLGCASKSGLARTKPLLQRLRPGPRAPDFFDGNGLGALGAALDGVGILSFSQGVISAW